MVLVYDGPSTPEVELYVGTCLPDDDDVGHATLCLRAGNRVAPYHPPYTGVSLGPCYQPQTQYHTQGDGHTSHDDSGHVLPV